MNSRYVPNINPTNINPSSSLSQQYQYSQDSSIYPPANSQESAKNNGRVNIQTPNINSLFKLYDKIPAKECTTYRNAVEGILEKNILSDTYFSEANIKILQDSIRAGVYEKSNKQYIIAPQDCDALKTVMRSIYLQYGANRKTKIAEQIRDLNKMVLDYCIPQVYSEAQGYMIYLKDASTMYVPMPHPVMAQDRDKLLELKPWF